MEQSQEQPRLSNFEVQERATEAQALLGNPVFVSAIDDVYSRAVGTLLAAEVGSLTASTAHASMKAVRDIKAQLEQYIADHKMRQKYNKGDK
jgi:hypothetical protein